MHSILTDTPNPPGLEATFTPQTSLTLIIELRTIRINLPAPVVEEVASFEALRTIRVDIFAAEPISAEGREDTLILEQNVPSDAIATASGPGVVDFALYVPWEALVPFYVESRGALHAD